VRRGPGAVLVQRAVVESAEVDLVELRHDEVREITAREDKRERLLCAPELRCYAERDLLGLEELAQETRLLDTLRGQPLARRGAGRDAVAIRTGERMADQDE
jgi:hypothetical protein